MAHSQHAKTPKLNALLIGKRTVPSGCRVLNVSQQGMSLKCNPDGRLLTFTNGDSIDIYLSVQHNNGHNKFTIPAIVSHVDENTIDVVFHCTDPELAGLIESYRTSQSHNLEASIDLRKVSRKESIAEPVAVNESIGSIARPDGPNTQSSRLYYTGLLALFITSLLLIGSYYLVSSINKRLNALEVVTGSHTEELSEVQTQAFSSRLQDGRYASLNARMKALTDAFKSFEKRVTQTLPQDPVIIATAEPELVNEPPAITKPQAETKKKAILLPPPAEKTPRAVTPSTSVEEATVAMTTRQPVEEPGTPSQQNHPAIETQHVAPVATTPSQAAPKPAPSTSNSDKPVKIATKHTPAVNADPQPAAIPAAAPAAKPTQATRPVTAHAGPWVINILSSTDKTYVEKAMTNAQSKGFDVVVIGATVKGKQYWRLQAPGFVSMAAAKTAARPIKEQLKIKDVWIFKH